MIWLKGVDFLSGLLFGAWFFKLAYPADIRRVFLGLLIGACFYSVAARRRLFFVRTFRSALALLTKQSKLRKRVALAFSLLLIAKGALKALALEYPLFDVGIFHQLLWNLSQGNGYLSSISGAEHFLRDHFVLSLAVAAPFYRLASLDAWTLGVAPGFLAGGLLALVFLAWLYLAENLPMASSKKRAFISSTLILSAWGFQCFYGNLHWGLHENLFGAAFLSWALALYFTRARFWFSIILLILAACTKESYLLISAFTSAGLLFAEEKKSRKVLFGIIAVTCFATFVWYAQSDRDPGKNYFTRYYGYLGADLKSMVKTLIFHPMTALQGMPLKEDLKYIVNLLLPFGILPALALFQSIRTRHKLSSAWLIFLGMLPVLGSSLISSHDTLRSPDLHYFFEVVPILGVLAIFALFYVRSRALHRWAVSFIVIAWFMFTAEPWRDLIPMTKQAFANVGLIEKMNQIPRDAIVMTQNGAGTWLAARKKASDWNDLNALGNFCPDYIMFEADPGISYQHSQKMGDIEQIMRKCRVQEGKSLQSPELIDVRGHWWIYQTAFLRI